MDGVPHAVPELAPACAERTGAHVFAPPDAEDVLDEAIAWLDAGRRVAMATVIKTWGSAPRPVGSQLAVNDRTAFVGSVSGGCVESATVRAALDAMKEGRPRRLSFGVSRSDVFDVGLTCGGEIQLFVECVTRDRELFERLRRARSSHQSVVVATALDDGRHVLFPDGRLELDSTDGADAAALQEAGYGAHRRGESTLFACGGTEWFLHVRHPPRRLLIVGAVHIAQALAPMAALNGFHVTLVDPRGAFATPERFPGVELVLRWPDEVMAELAPDHRTAVVVLAHDPRLDDPALACALDSNAFYVGALGSRRAHADRLDRLASRGVPPERFGRIHGPVGLAIGAVTTAEIATSIMADIVRTLRQVPA
ncbi:MAG TPA: XdhC/CoxI family protein [Polyangiaceae bacterium]|jgi:xanthine dehydrogenase accessory factor|nr:XdhC/CoxI family protein [Polyangiaceae bacterium]